MSATKPCVFVGSSSEGLRVAKALQVLLDYSCEVQLWTQGVFGVSDSTLDSLLRQAQNSDFAILLLTADDQVESRGESMVAPRDNVLFELGLFMAAIGRNRTFVVYDRSARLKIPSDLAGVTFATYEPHSSGNLLSALGAASTLIEGRIHQIGRKEVVESRPHTTVQFSEWSEVPFKERVVAANTIDLLATANYVFLSQNQSLLLTFIERGGRLRCALVDPNMDGIKTAAATSSGFERDPGNVGIQVNLALMLLRDLSIHTSDAQSVQVKLIDHTPFAVITMMDRHAPSAVMYVTLYGFAQVPTLRPSFTLTKAQSEKWFEFYARSFEEIWDWQGSRSICIREYEKSAD